MKEQAMQLLIKAKIMDLRGVFWKKFIEICERYEMGKKEIIFFGSYAMGKERKDSDIDLIIVTKIKINRKYGTSYIMNGTWFIK